MVLLFHQFPCHQRCSEDHYKVVNWIGSEHYFRGSDFVFTVYVFVTITFHLLVSPEPKTVVDKSNLVC